MHGVFDACIKWAATRCSMKGIGDPTSAYSQTELGNCLELIRLEDMERKEFFIRFESIKLMLPTEQCIGIMKHLMFTKSAERNTQPRGKSKEDLEKSIIFISTILHVSPTMNSIDEVKFSISKSLMFEAMIIAPQREEGSHLAGPIRVWIYRNNKEIFNYCTQYATINEGTYISITFPKSIYIKKDMSHLLKLSIPCAFNCFR